ncbi:MAG: nucleotidyltransferase domain-containing protein [Candidatus Coatesbacteria bacterium]|mgnify:CR=1 FL=1
MTGANAGAGKPALATARKVARRLRGDGARAVVLVGSYAHGRTHYASDIDLHVIGKRGEHVLERCGGYLFSISRGTAADARRGFRDPFAVGKDVPGWRHAVILEDPHGIGRRLRLEARRWRWGLIKEKVNREVADAITHRAENVHKILGLLSQGWTMAAAVQRSFLAIVLPGILAVHLRILYESENDYAELVARKMGQPWIRCQRAALGGHGESSAAASEATLALYLLAAAKLWPLLDQEQRAVVGGACDLIRRRNRV